VIKVLSYCLFEPKVLPQHRYWDNLRQDPHRYWYNIPALVLANKILYPDYKMYLYVSKNIWDNPNSNILPILETVGNLKIHTIDWEYSLTEPAIWRMIPLWDPEVGIFHTRDLDSIPTEIEYQYVRVFERSSYAMGTLRTNRAHTPNGAGLKCRMLAGLSSFKPQQVPVNLKLNNFSEYYEKRHPNYGSDQDLMVSQFTMDPTYTKDKFLDHCAYDQKDPQHFPCGSVKPEWMENVIISSEKKEISTSLKKNNLDNWAGEPVDARGDFTLQLLQKPQFENIFTEMTRQLVWKI